MVTEGGAAIFSFSIFSLEEEWWEGRQVFVGGCMCWTGCVCESVFQKVDRKRE